MVDDGPNVPLCPSEFVIVILIEHLIRGIPITCDSLHRLYNAIPHAVSCSSHESIHPPLARLCVWSLYFTKRAAST